MILVLAPQASFAQRSARSAPIDPVGTWRCVLYGNPSVDDERVLLRFAPDSSTHMARWSTQGNPAWLRISDWQIVEDQLRFIDSRSGRWFEVDLARDTLSGEWRTYNLLGGWWCSKAGAETGSGVDILGRADSADERDTRRLIPEIMATPTFPIQAVREAREGRVVLCFIVEPSGEVYEPEFVELTDDIFRATSLDALMRSRYKPWDPDRDGGARPACRSFVYRLDYRNEAAVGVDQVE